MESPDNYADDVNRGKGPFQELADSLPDLFFALDFNLRYTCWNKAIETYTGIPAKDVIGKWLYDLYPKTRGTDLERVYLEVLKTRQPLNMVSPFIFQGQQRYFEIDCRPADSGLFVFIQDVTERKAVEEAWKENVEKYRALFEAEADAIFLIDRDTGQILEANQQASLLYGFSREELLTKKNFDLSAEPEKTHQSTEEKHQRIPVRWHKKMDGTVFPVEIAAGHLMWRGRWAHIAAIRDITDRIKREEEFAQKEKDYRTIFNAVPAFIWYMDIEGKILRSNKAARDMIQDAEGDYIGKNYYDLFPPEEAKKFFADSEEVIRSGQPKVGIIESYSLLGNAPRWARTDKIPYTDEKGNSLGVIVIVSDITEQKESEDKIWQLNATLERRVEERTRQFEAVNKELATISYSIAHDLRAPLRALNGYSHVLQEEYAYRLDARGLSYLHRISEASNQLGNILDDMIALLRVTRQKPVFKDVNLSSLALTIFEQVSSAQPERLVEFVCAPGLVVRADRDMMGLVMENLLSNAWKFTQKTPSARIEVGSLQQGGSTVFFVRDNGAGFDMAYAKKLFGLFQHLHSPGEYKGTGIGLAITQRAIQRHNGHIWAESEPGRGATFYFTLG